MFFIILIYMQLTIVIMLIHVSVCAGRIETLTVVVFFAKTVRNVENGSLVDENIIQ